MGRHRGGAQGWHTWDGTHRGGTHRDGTSQGWHMGGAHGMAHVGVAHVGMGRHRGGAQGRTWDGTHRGGTRRDGTSQGWYTGDRGHPLSHSDPVPAPCGGARPSGLPSRRVMGLPANPLGPSDPGDAGTQRCRRRSGVFHGSRCQSSLITAPGGSSVTSAWGGNAVLSG